MKLAKAVRRCIKSWPRNRVGFLAFFILSLLLCNLVLRVVLFQSFGPGQVRFGELIRAFGTGLVMDLFVALVVCLPLLFALLVFPSNWFQARWVRGFWNGGFLLFWGVNVFLLAAEFFFFDEFKSRFNTVSVDYLIYPHEVFINIWDTYPVAWVLAGTAMLATLWIVMTGKIFRGQMWSQPVSMKNRFLHLGTVMVTVCLLWPMVGNHLTRFSTERTLNEIAGNGWYSFVQAAVTRELEYAPFYRTMPLDEAYARVRRLVNQTNSTFVEEGHSIRRLVAGDPLKPKLNVVVFLEESLGSEFFGSLGRQGTSLTPELDLLAKEDGMLFTRIYASGNRTVRGMEGVVCSFPPLPGDSVVVRSRGNPIETLAKVLKRDDYSTMFLYGGRGIFDNVRPFMTANGYEQFVEQKDFPNPTFKTIWGVCNEDLYQRGLEECRKLNQGGKPFLVTMLSVSNHKPFTYPKGRIRENPDERKRDNAVKYTDYALGEFFKAAKKEPFWTNTVFVVVADHGARVYGRQTIPMKSYEIPFLVVGPAVVKKPVRIRTQGGQLDVAPTILGLIGRPYESTFFGRDLFQLDAQTGRSVLNHNRDIGLYRNERMVVLGLNKTHQFFHGDPKKKQAEEVNVPDADDLEVELDATALFQVADDLYKRKAFDCTKEEKIISASPLQGKAL